MKLCGQEKKRFLEGYIHERYQEWFRRDPDNIVGVHVTDLEIVFHVIKKRPAPELHPEQMLPEILTVDMPGGEQMLVPTAVRETGAFQFQLQPGNEIDNRTANEAGSLGPFLTDGTHTYLITNFHVAAMHLMRAGQFFFNADNGDGPGELLINGQDYALKFGAFNPDVDLGLIEFGENAAFNNILPDGNVISSDLVPTASLSAPFYTYSPSHPYGFTINVTADDMPFHTGFNNVVIEHAMMADRFSIPGDSGSVVVDSSYRFAGILLGAENGNSFILPYPTINAYITNYYKPLTIL
jgi:hypothetical protein